MVAHIIVEQCHGGLLGPVMGHVIFISLLLAVALTNVTLTWSVHTDTCRVYKCWYYYNPNKFLLHVTIV